MSSGIVSVGYMHERLSYWSGGILEIGFQSSKFWHARAKSATRLQRCPASQKPAYVILQASLQLTDRQMQELVQTRQIYLEGLGKLLRERAELYAIFQGQTIVCFESHQPSQGFARTFDAAEQLSENLREEQRIWTQMIAVTFRRVRGSGYSERACQD